MRPETRLDSAVFHLTPTRTRCDLVIIANGKTEKLASGLLNPFLAHLKTAQDQIAKGGYSITLEPDLRVDTPWFTKGVLERFVRFVSTPEVLERVNTIEAEILQIEKAITIQGNENLGLSTVEEHQMRSVEYTEGGKSTLDADAGKALVLYKPGAHPPESNGSTRHEEHSKVKLLRVLETRKTVLQKEQGMAFARAVAAGFDMDHMAHMIAFSECFGASRLMVSGIKFMELWKAKHDSGQWLEIEAVEAMSTQSDFSAMNASGIMLSGDTRNQSEFREAWPVSNGDLGTESNGKATNHVGAEMRSHNLSSDHDTDRRPPGDPHVPLGPQEYFQRQQHAMFPQWPVHSPPGAPVFQHYPMQGIPYYPNYPGSGPFFQPPYPPMEDPRFSAQQSMGLRKRHSMDSKESNAESETCESQDGADHNLSELEKEVPQSHKKVSRSGRKKSGMVVIRNINYITSKRHNTSGSESQSSSESETDKIEEIISNALDSKHRNSSRSSKSKGSHTKSTDTLNSYHEETANGHEADSGNWQAFQSFLLRDEEKSIQADRGMFSGEKEPPVKRQQNQFVADPILPPDRDYDDVSVQRIVEFDTINGKAIRMSNRMAAEEEQLHSSEGKELKDNQLDIEFTEIEGRRGGYKRPGSDDFMIFGLEQQYTKSNLDPLVENENERASDFDKGSKQNVTDESFIVPLRSDSHEQVAMSSTSDFDVDLVFPSGLQRTDDPSSRINNQVSYEPDDLSLMPERGMEMESVGYDPAMDYNMEVYVESPATVEDDHRENVSVSAMEQLSKSDKEKKSRVLQDKRKMDAPMRKGRPSKVNPLAEAQARAGKLRAFKADLQKAKKEKEEEEMKRIEALKRERQKRIAARGSSNAAQAPLTPQKNKAHLPTKLSPGSSKVSKFSDSEPGSSSPLPKVPIRSVSVLSNDSQKINRSSRQNGSTHLAGNGLSRSVSSLPELKKDSSGPVPEQKEASTRTKRLSDIKGSVVHHASSPKSVNGDQVPKKNLSDPKGNIHRALSLKSVSSDKVAKQNLSDEPQIKKIAVTNLDRSKSAVVPEVDISTSRTPDTVHNKLNTKDSVQKQSEIKPSLSSEGIEVKKNYEKSPQLSNGDDNMIVEKTVVILERETVPNPVKRSSEVMIETRHGSYKVNTGENVEVVSEYAAIHAPALPISIKKVEKNPNDFHLDQKPNSYEVAIDYPKNEAQKLSNSIVTDEPDQASYAQATALEDSSTANTENSEALQLVSREVSLTSTETIREQLPILADASSVEQIHESFEKPRSKESSKGFRKLLKFGRKNHSSALGEQNLDSDSSSVDDHPVIVSNSSEVPSLKNLLSQDDTQVEGTPAKLSRHFSLLSPFRAKTSEKKLAV